jgi:hypothetical protein
MVAASRTIESEEDPTVSGRSPACKVRGRGDLTWFGAVEALSCVLVSDRDSPLIAVRSGTQRARPNTA